MQPKSAILNVSVCLSTHISFEPRIQTLKLWWMLPLVTDFIFVGDGVDSMFVYTGNWSGKGIGFTVLKVTYRGQWFHSTQTDSSGYTTDQGPDVCNCITFWCSVTNLQMWSKIFQTWLVTQEFIYCCYLPPFSFGLYFVNNEMCLFSHDYWTCLLLWIVSVYKQLRLAVAEFCVLIISG